MAEKTAQTVYIDADPDTVMDVIADIGSYPEWVKEYKGGLKNYNKLLKAGEKHSIEKTGVYLRGMMPWMSKKNLKGVQASY